MAELSLLDVDVRIAKLRDQIAAGQANLETMAELDLLIDRRIALINAKAGEAKSRPRV
jgi:hypothetical protein